MNSVRRIVSGALIAAAMAAPAFAQDAVGKWTGIVKAPGQDLPIVVIVTKDAAGKLSATLESPSQAPGLQIAADTVANEGDTFAMAIAALRADYKATWNSGAKAWVGSFVQSGTPMDLTMTRAPD